ADGSSANGTLTVRFDDDLPTASAEADQSVAEGDTVTGTLDFAGGADGAAVSHVNGEALVFDAENDGYSQAIALDNGTLEVKADGSYRYTADDNLTQPASDSATFTVTDNDGDSASATLSFTITDANAPTAGESSALVDDEGLEGGIDGGVGDDVGQGDETSFSGTLAFDFGGDGAGSVSLAAMDGATGTVGTESVRYAWDGATGT
ncbi:Ig-like domain-containing protein, partial [Halomonas koreensis]